MRSSRWPALFAAALTVAAIGVPAAAWWITGSRESARGAERLADLALAATGEDVEVGADRLAARLIRLLDAESRRPYQHYSQNAGPSSAFATVPSDPMVLTWLQVDSAYRVSLPELGQRDPERLSGLRAELADLAPVIVASLSPECPEGARRPTEETCVGPMLWRTLRLGSRDELAALRHVETKEGSLTQGFLVDLEEARTLMPEGAEFRPGPGASEVTCLVPLVGDAWHVAGDHSARSAWAAAEAESEQAAFRWRFAIGLAIAIAAGLGVLALAWQARRLARVREAFAAAAAHELRTPLAALRLHGGLLRSDLKDADQIAKSAQHVADEADRLSRVVANLMSFTLRERGDLGLRVERCDVALVVSAQVERQRAVLEGSGAVLEACYEPSKPAWCDPEAIAQVVQNLLDNALRHGHSAGGRRIRVGVSAKRPGHVDLTVEDAGPGIPPGERRRIFRPFHRGRGADATGGLGLGLALSRSIARACGGDLRCGSSDLGGARFEVSLRSADSMTSGDRR